MSRGSNIVGVGEHNELLVLSIIRRHGALSKAELSARTGLSRQALTDVVGRLEGDGRLRREELVRGKVGQPKVPFSLNPGGAYTVGLKVGRRSFELVLVDFVGTTMEAYRHVFRYPVPAALEHFVTRSWAELCRTTAAGIMDRIVGIGVAMPGELWRWTEEIDVPGDLLGTWETFDIAGLVRTVTGVEPQIMNDVTAACIGELMFGQSRSPHGFVYFYIGAFVGGGLVLDDMVIEGSHANAAAFGSMLVVEKDGTASQPRQLLSCVSLVNLHRQIEAAGMNADFLWQNPEEWPVLGAMLDGWIADTGWHLAVAAINAVAVVDVAQVVIDGSLPADIRVRICDATRAAMTNLRTTGVHPPGIFEGSQGYSARPVGAAALPMYNSFGYRKNVNL
ncbi:ROK family transcriptional regulator [Sphingobium sp. SA2]|uniref:ROK family transcriptional regulator n=1 Tax=unclassified Sphingobium TaxID=2611147 RepID=UPI000501D650|nr:MULTISPECIES: ROK family transcriptional regulator [unclassified Sphingobium]KFL48745.1 hypothetical protein IL54_0002 [Sphingobium sp. ba1]MDT7532335.1 ROK family transcriptional regulator [Sphingobium sp. SA2]